ncbi:hypothetical protein ACFY2T_09620 [Streptomyces sp. NPDC001260]|uniref:hypothetical protein n=1 Tax=Streptomyces TaxID=1883 RepID=UPI0036C21F5C
MVVTDGEFTGPSRSARLRGPSGPGAHASCGCCAFGGGGCDGSRDCRGDRVCARPCARVAAGGPAASDRSSIGRASPVAPHHSLQCPSPAPNYARRSPCRDDTPVSSLRDIVPLRSVTTSGVASTDRVREVAEGTGNGLHACCARREGRARDAQVVGITRRLFLS